MRKIITRVHATHPSGGATWNSCRQSSGGSGVLTVAPLAGANLFTNEASETPIVPAGAFTNFLVGSARAGELAGQSSDPRARRCPLLVGRSSRMSCHSRRRMAIPVARPDGLQQQLDRGRIHNSGHRPVDISISSPSTSAIRPAGESLGRRAPSTCCSTAPVAFQDMNTTTVPLQRIGSSSLKPSSRSGSTTIIGFRSPPLP